jgi:hypothetical protein
VINSNSPKLSVNKKKNSLIFAQKKVCPQNSATSFISIYQIVKKFPTCLLCCDRLLMSSKLFTKKRNFFTHFFVPLLKAQASMPITRKMRVGQKLINR